VRERERVARRSNLAYFKDAQEVYDTLGKLFQDPVTRDELAPKFRLGEQGRTDLIDA
jgi:hypothetical protein